MLKTVSLEALTDEEIERLTYNRIKSKVGKLVEPVGSTTPNHEETSDKCECTVCRNGISLERAGSAVCLRCNRASKHIEKAIKAVKAEERVLQSVAAEKRVDYIKAKALQQLRGGRVRRGARPNPARMAAVKNTIKAELAKRGE